MSFWPVLPVEIKEIVIKYTDFLSSHHLRLCSEEEFNFVNSLKTKINFLKIGIYSNQFTFLIVQSPSEILRIDLKNGKKDSEVTIFRNQSLNCENDGKNLKETNIKNEISMLLNGFFQRNLEIESLLLENNENESEIVELIGKKLLEIQPKTIIFSGKYIPETMKKVDFLKKSSEIKIRNWTKDESKNWNDFKNFGLKAYEITKWKTKNGVQEHITAKVGIGFISYIAHIQSNPKRCFHWIPGFHLEDPERKFSGSGIDYEKFPSQQTYKIGIDSKNCGFFKFTECGVLIQICPRNSVFLEDNTCGLEWMCPTCLPNTMENWFFRETIGSLH